ncbi:MAG: tetrahydromethanopterin S-methyltransferase subunit B [Methanocorpusculum sp.]|nr:tetrahydromethanopterin S-methyltransferase subunit B [Methanocorpusculum sp.]
MGYIYVLPEFGLVADPVAGVVTTAGISYKPILDQVEELEMIADDLVGMLSGEGKIMNSFPGREKSLSIAGKTTAFWYGLVIGLFVAFIVTFFLVFGGFIAW